MTSTKFNIGLIDERSSSRVLRPPGGGFTDVLGLGPDPVPVQPKRGNQRNISSISEGTSGSVCETVGAPAPAPTETSVKPTAPTPTEAVKPTAPAPVEPVKPTVSSPIEPVKTPVTSPIGPVESAPTDTTAPITDNGTASKPVKTAEAATGCVPPQTAPQRVRVPPGGFSSGLW